MVAEEYRCCARVSVVSASTMSVGVASPLRILVTDDAQVLACLGDGRTRQLHPRPRRQDAAIGQRDFQADVVEDRLGVGDGLLDVGVGHAQVADALAAEIQRWCSDEGPPPAANP